LGDSPIDRKTGQPLWAEPGFDDSKWETVDLTPKDGATDPAMGASGHVPGWTAKGHPGYFGYAWYRIRVEVQAKAGRELALAGPADVDDAYQVFDNGEPAGHFGDFTGGTPKTSYPIPKMFLLPGPSSREAVTGQDGTGLKRTGQDATNSARTGPAETTRILAFRVWMSAQSLGFGDVGGIHSAPVLGEPGAVAAGYQMSWLELIRTFASLPAEAVLFVQLAVLAFTLIAFDRSDRVYPWMGALFLLIASLSALDVIGGCTEALSFANVNLVEDFVDPAARIAWVMVWWVWFGLQRPLWLPRLTAVLALLLTASYIVHDEYFLGLMPHAAAARFSYSNMTFRVLFFVALLWVVIEGIRKQGVEGWLVLPVVVLHGLNDFEQQLPFTNIRLEWFPFGVDVNFFNISNALVAVVIALLLLRRLIKSVKRQRLMELDVKQAQEVQQVILPEALLAVAGLTIESEYCPAREVGGDFFQIIPHQSDGSVLIVAGDVSGKGLKAGMLVALLVGAIRSTARFSDDPAAVLGELNLRLMDRNDAQATCLALRIEADRAATLPNGGHVAPYLNGEELPMEGALPLGMFEGAEASVMHLELKDGDRLVLMSDGIAEAMDASGKLFGFERVGELVRRATSAAEVAGAAQAFGQEDDISVIFGYAGCGAGDGGCLR
jgi:uncharacterized membrane protein